MWSYFPIKNVCFRFDLRVKFERFGDDFTFLLVVHLVIPETFIVLNFFFFGDVNVRFEYFGHDLLGISDLWLFDLLKSLRVSLDLHFEVMYELSEFLYGPVIDIDFFTLIFNRSHVIHKCLWVNSFINNLISKEDLFFLLSLRLPLHNDCVILLCFDIIVFWYKI